MNDDNNDDNRDDYYSNNNNDNKDDNYIYDYQAINAQITLHIKMEGF